MNWIRCKECNDLKQEVEYYKNGNARRRICKACMQKKYFLDKNKKKEYDKQRYEQIKKNKKETRNVCMRCGKYYVNVRNNQLEWCFHCLEKYEKEYKLKIKVEVVMPFLRKVKSVTHN